MGGGVRFEELTAVELLKSGIVYPRPYASEETSMALA